MEAKDNDLVTFMITNTIIVISSTVSNIQVEETDKDSSLLVGLPSLLYFLTL